MTWDPITDKRIATLHPDVRATAEDFINQVEKDLEIQLRITHALRTWEEQHKLYMQPHDGIDNDHDGQIDEADEKVTNADAGDSFHNYGLAWDVCEMVHGQVKWDTEWLRIAAIAKAMNIEWGGNFKSLKDKPHFQVSFGHSLAALKALQREGSYPIFT